MIKSILSNEKYCGDALQQKTFVQDCINKKVVKNTGQLPMYLVENNHPAIVTREKYRAVQAEQARRSSAKSPSVKNSPTGRTSYASKYALSERLVCGECGTLYRRCTWSRNGQKKVVWRCVSRLDYGTKYCHESPTMEEGKLQQAIIAAINTVMDPKDYFVQQIMESMEQEIVTAPNSTLTLGDIKRRMEELQDEFRNLLAVVSDGNAESYADRFRSIAEEMAQLKSQQEEISSQLRNNSQLKGCLNGSKRTLYNANHHLIEWNEEMIRQLVHTVKVISADHIKVTLYDGAEIHQEVRKQ